MKNSNRRKLPSWFSIAATILMVTPVIPACAQAPAEVRPAAPAQPAAEKTAPTKTGSEKSGLDRAAAESSSTSTPRNRAEAYYHDALAAIYEDEAINQGHPDDVTRAIEEYKYALNDDPDSPGLQNGLADLYYRTGRVQDAETTLNALLKKLPDNIQGNKLLGRIYLRQLGEQSTMSSQSASSAVLNKAIAQFQKIVSLEPNDVDNRMVLGQLYTVNHEADKAEQEFKTAQALEPDSEEVVLNLVRVYAESGNLKQAAKVIEDVPVDSRTPKMEFALGATYQQLKDPKAAISAYQRAVQMEPDNLRSLNALAEALMNNNQLDEALKKYQQLAKADPEEPDVLVHIGEIQQRQGKYQDALETVRKARKLDPTNLEAGFNEGVLLDVLGRFDEAEKAYKGMLESNKLSHANGAYTDAERNNRAIFLQSLGKLYMEENKIDDAVATFQKMIDLGGDSAVRGYEGQMEAYQTAHQPDKALAVAHKAVAAQPKNKDLKLMLAGALADQGQPDQGIEMAKSLLTNKPADLGIWEAIAQMNVRLKRWKDAEDNLNKAEPLATTKDEKTYLLFLRGEWAERQKHLEPAERYFREALALDPNSAMTLNYLGYMLADKGTELPEALKMIQKAVSLQPGNAAYLDSLGWAYFKMGDYELAEDNLRSAVQRDQTDGTVHMHLGDLYEKTGRIRQAAAQWQLSLTEFSKSNPADVEAGDVAKVQKKLESARVKLAKEDSQLTPPKP